MTLGLSILQSYREFQRNWTRLADAAFGNAVQGEAARGEFISDFISERGLSFPKAGDGTRRPEN